MSVPVTQDTATTQLMEQITHLSPDEQTRFVSNITNPIDPLNPQQLREAMQATLSRDSVHAETSLVQGGYDAGTATAVSASVGVGMDELQVQEAEAAFAQSAANAIREGRPLDQIPNSPNLTAAAQAAIYEQIAQQQGTSTAQIEAKAEAAKQADMQALQSGLFGSLIEGLSLTQLSGAVDLGSTTAALANGTKVPHIASVKPVEQEQGFTLT